MIESLSNSKIDNESSFWKATSGISNVPRVPLQGSSHSRNILIRIGLIGIAENQFFCFHWSLRYYSIFSLMTLHKSSSGCKDSIIFIDTKFPSDNEFETHEVVRIIPKWILSFTLNLKYADERKLVISTREKLQHPKSSIIMRQLSCNVIITTHEKNSRPCQFLHARHSSLKSVRLKSSPP